MHIFKLAEYLFNLAPKISGIRTRTVKIEGKYADHIATTFLQNMEMIISYLFYFGTHTDSSLHHPSGCF